MSFFGSDNRNSTSSLASNTISFNPVIEALTGTTGSSSPSITAPTSSTPSAPSNASGSDANSLAFPSSLLGLGSSTGGILTPGQQQPGSALYPSSMLPNTNSLNNPNTIGGTTNSTTVMWMIIGGGFFLVLMMGGQGGGRRH